MQPRVIYVVAYDKRNAIGKSGGLPWRLPADLRHFKALTIGKTVVMGRKTFASIGKPLKLRRNIVMTRDPGFYADGVEIARSVDDAFATTNDQGEIAVIGGREIFTLFEPYVESIYATQVDADVDGDVHYALPARDMVCVELGSQAADNENEYAMTFLRYDLSVHPKNSGGSANESKPSL